MDKEKNQSGVEIGVKLEANITAPIQNLTDVVCNAANFIGKILGPTLIAGGAIANDQFQHWRALNIQRLQEKWEERRRERGVSADAIKHLPFSIGARIFDGAAQEDNEEVQHLWAGLLDAATDPARKVDVRRVHIEILKAVTSVEVQILKFLWGQHTAEFVEWQKRTGADALQMLSTEERAIAIQNLKRQGCVRLKLDQSLISRIDRIKTVLAPGMNVSKDGFMDVINALKLLIANASGDRDDFYLAVGPGKLAPRSIPAGQRSIPELRFELTNLGADLMRLCEPDQKTVQS